MPNTPKPSLNLDDLSRMIDKGKDLLTITEEHNSMFRGETYKTVEYSAYQAWRSQILDYIRTRLTIDSHYYKGLSSALDRNSYLTSVETGLSILNTITQDVKAGVFTASSEAIDALMILKQLTDRFHKVALQLRVRREDRPTIDVTDEYDVQDLLHSLLHLYFDDIGLKK